MSATSTTIPFNRIIALDAINARAATKDGLDELERSIAAKGLIQPLAVRPSADADKYEVIDGRRRWLAMQRLVKSKQWAKATPVPVLIRNEDDAEALETSLVANTVRLPMHPVDQHAVFDRLVGQGVSETEIAARFGLAERTVRQQLALGRLAEPVRKAWRSGLIDAGIAQAFTCQPDHAAQGAAWEKLKGRAKNKSPYGGGLTATDVRRELTGERRPKSAVPPPVLERYVAAGGKLAEDLFEDQQYVEDVALLARITTEWQAAATAALRDRIMAQGWAWVALAADLPPQWRWGWDRKRVTSEISDASAARIDALEDQIVALDEGNDVEEDRLRAEIVAIEQEDEAQHYTAEQKARMGCVIEFRHDGSLIGIACGMIRPGEDGQTDIEDAIDEDNGGEDGGANGGEDLPSVGAMVGESDTDTDGDTDTDDAGDAGDDGTPAISAALLMTITTSQTEAAASVVARDAELALRIAVAALRTVSYASPSKLGIDHTAHARPETTGNFAKTFAQVRAMKYGEVIGEFARQVAGSLSLVAGHATAGREHHGALIDALDGRKYLEAMRAAFLAEDYFKRATKATALAAIDEMREAGCGQGIAPDDVLADAKKADLVEIATRAALACGWLPSELRHADYAIAARPGALTGKMAAAEQTGEVGQ